MDNTFDIPDYTEPVIAARTWLTTDVVVPTNLPPVPTTHTHVYVQPEVDKLVKDARQIIKNAELEVRGLTDGERILVEGMIHEIDQLRVNAAAGDPLKTFATNHELRLKSPYHGGSGLNEFVWKPGFTEAVCNKPPSNLQYSWKAELLQDHSDIHTWQSFYPIRKILGGKRLHLELDLKVPDADIEKALTEGILLKFDKKGELHLDVPGVEEPPPPPHADHRCGLYAMSHVPIPSRNEIVGLVELTGRIIPATQGWRAQKARPFAFVYGWHEKNALQPLADAYSSVLLSDVEASKLLSNPEDYRRDK